MNKKLFDYVLNYLLTSNTPNNRALYNSIKDKYHKGGIITDKQFFKWTYPKNLKYYTKQELKEL